MEENWSVASTVPDKKKNRTGLGTLWEEVTTALRNKYYSGHHKAIWFWFDLISNSQSSSWSIAWLRQWGVNNLPKVVAQQRHG